MMDSESGYTQRIRAALTVSNVVLFLFGLAVGAAVTYGVLTHA